MATKIPQHKKKLSTRLKNDWQIYLLCLPGIVYFIVFHYFPMYGIQIAFRDYKAALGITGSPFVGLKHFQAFFEARYCVRMISNTLLLNILSLVISFPIPIILALLLNRIKNARYKKFTQTVIYMPHFISSVVLAGMLYIFLAPDSGLINRIIVALGGKSTYFMAQPQWFRPIYILSGIWQSAGWDSILYIAALTGVDQEIYEAATLDGANIHQKIWHIDIPAILPIAVMMLILGSGRIMGGDTQKALLLNTQPNNSASEIIGVYVYNIGLGKAQFSYTAAIGLFQNVIGFVMIVTVNTISKRLTNVGMF